MSESTDPLSFGKQVRQAGLLAPPSTPRHRFVSATRHVKNARVQDDDMHEEVLLEEPEPQGAAAAAPVAAAAPPPVAPPAAATSGSDTLSASDPLSLARGSGEAGAGYQDVYAPRRQQQQQQQQQQQPQQQAPLLAAPPTAASGSSSTGTASLPHHRPQGSLTLDSLEIGGGEGDSGFLSGSAGGAGPSSRPPPMLQVRVSDPVRRVADSRIPGFTSTHFEFLVTTTAEAPRRRFEVRRRFSDFVVSGWGS